MDEAERKKKIMRSPMTDEEVLWLEILGVEWAISSKAPSMMVIMDHRREQLAGIASP
eukprot:CAMPEP_0185779812 /NCGR_PEP_ID=MMETSP1174-20130828/97005_1 /TAXON_ID=35687 /ORGANISM="Dictyocha speculum, Strain CCMP1381" /LENGTH=56 /DNA_ID=CAMNT_0028469077 /DNA_START=1 /DNA_END=168 /DNA_ORIENTATION=-